MEFHFDDDGFRKAVDAAVADHARKAQPDFDRLHTTHAGRPVAEIEPRLKALFDKYGLEPSDPATIRSYAQALADGTRIQLR